jgi:hypothetical protein
MPSPAQRAAPSAEGPDEGVMRAELTRLAYRFLEIPD